MQKEKNANEKVRLKEWWRKKEKMKLSNKEWAFEENREKRGKLNKKVLKFERWRKRIKAESE